MLSLISRDVLDPMLRGTEVGKKTREKKEVLRYRNGTEGKRERFVPSVTDTRQKEKKEPESLDNWEYPKLFFFVSQIYKAFLDCHDGHHIKN